MTIYNKKYFIVFSGVAALMISAVFWIFGFIYFASNIIPHFEENIETTEKPKAIVALTGGRNRLNQAIQLLNQGKAERLFISGVGENSNLTNTLILSGPLPDGISLLLENIEIGYEAKDTVGNAKETAKWAKSNNIKSIYLVTANYHMPRSMALFSEHAPELNITPFPISSPSVETEGWIYHDGSKRLLINEYNKYIVVKLQQLLGL